MDGWQTTYLVLAIVAGILLLLSFVLGDLLGDLFGDFLGDIFPSDIDVEGPSGVSSSTILAALTAVGIIGYAITVSGLPAWQAFIAAVAGGFLVGWTVYLFVKKVLVKSQYSSHISRTSYVGLQAVVTIPLKSGLQGEVRFTDSNGSVVTQPATTAEDEIIPADTSVEIVSVESDSVTVVSFR